jgi:hypothetical protein
MNYCAFSTIDTNRVVTILGIRIALIKRDFIMRITNQSIIAWAPEIKSFPPSFYKGRNYPSLTKRGEGRFSEEYLFSIMDSLVRFVGKRQRNQPIG